MVDLDLEKSTYKPTVWIRQLMTHSPLLVTWISNQWKQPVVSSKVRQWKPSEPSCAKMIRQYYTRACGPGKMLTPFWGWMKTGSLIWHKAMIISCNMEWWPFSKLCSLIRGGVIGTGTKLQGLQARYPVCHWASKTLGIPAYDYPWSVYPTFDSIFTCSLSLVS